MIDLKTVDFGQLKQAVKAFNDCGLVEKLGLTPLRTVGIKKEDIAKEFIRVIGVVADKELGDDLPDESAAMYNFCFSDEMDDSQKEELLLDSEEEELDEVEDEVEDELEDDIEEEDDLEDSEEVEDDEVEDEDDIEEEEAPKAKKVAAKPKKEKAPKAVKTPKEPKPKKEKAPKAPRAAKATEAKSKFGHILSKPTGQMDEMLEGGSSIEKLIEVLGIEKKAVSRHLRRLKRKGFIVTKKTSDDDSMSQIYKVSEPKK